MRCRLLGRGRGREGSRRSPAALHRRGRGRIDHQGGAQPVHRHQQDGQRQEEDYEVIASSYLTLGILGAMMVLGEIAGKFAKAVWAEVKGLFKPRPAEVPVPKPAAPAAEPRTFEPPKEPGTPVKEPAAGGEPQPTPETKTPEPPSKAGEAMPPEDVAHNLGKLEDRVGSAENVKRVTDPEFVDGYDAEVKVDDHTLRVGSQMEHGASSVLRSAATPSSPTSTPKSTRPSARRAVHRRYRAKHRLSGPGRLR